MCAHSCWIFWIYIFFLFVDASFSVYFGLFVFFSLLLFCFLMCSFCFLIVFLASLFWELMASNLIFLVYALLACAGG